MEILFFIGGSSFLFLPEIGSHLLRFVRVGIAACLKVPVIYLIGIFPPYVPFLDGIGFGVGPVSAAQSWWIIVGHEIIRKGYLESHTAAARAVEHLPLLEAVQRVLG